ncbi:MAG TPA: Crp/Fnr family transcriptional regulator [Flavisolibacter sp.]|jgi:CRP-like cAMP-binding protein|nr:Crp/Fnr family transcriptional regulator [Flavisolibacter sp.]
MNVSLLLQNIAKHIQLDPVEIDYFTSLLHEKKLTRKAFLQRQGEDCPYINFVVSGALRAYYSDETGKESTIMFAINDWWITDMYCFLNEQKAMVSIVAIEDCELLQLHKRSLDKLFNHIPKFERYFRILMQNAYTREQVRMLQRLSSPAEVRYLQFLEKYPQMIRHITQKQLASYLGISPEFLSTIRKKLSRKSIS